MPNTFPSLSPEVADAIAEGMPVVALESTVIAHGLPRPGNLEIANELEGLIRAGGAVPATVGVIDGRAIVGVTVEQMERLAMGDGVEKLSTKDLAVAIARRATGGTTVASTAYLAHRAGIEVFATGGIGGVHRGPPLDVSADLLELQRTPIVVVSAGAKSILDLRATREMLETLGVFVLGWRTDDFPAFHTQSSGLAVDARVEDATGVAEIWRSHRSVSLPGAVLLCAAIPASAALPAEALDATIERALRRASAEGIEGKAITPFLLRAITEETGGASIEANLALLRHNATVAAEVAVELARR